MVVAISAMFEVRDGLGIVESNPSCFEFTIACLFVLQRWLQNKVMKSRETHVSYKVGEAERGCGIATRVNR